MEVRPLIGKSAVIKTISGNIHSKLGTKLYTSERHFCHINRNNSHTLFISNSYFQLSLELLSLWGLTAPKLTTKKCANDVSKLELGSSNLEKAQPGQNGVAYNKVCKSLLRILQIFVSHVPCTFITGWKFFNFLRLSRAKTELLIKKVCKSVLLILQIFVSHVPLDIYALL